MFKYIAAIAAAVILLSLPALAYDPFSQCADSSCAAVSENRLATDNSNVVLLVMRVVLMALGGISVLMVVVGGLKFVLSQGDPSAIQSAKNTILYAIVGIVVALLAGGIVQFVTGQFL